MLHLLTNHIETMYRVETENRAGQMFYTWKSSNKRDHFVHALNYMEAAAKRVRIMEQIGEDDDTDKKRPYDNFETPEERIERFDREYAQDQDLPEYLSKYVLDNQ
jgi:hypothetical protein